MGAPRAAAIVAAGAGSLLLAACASAPRRAVPAPPRPDTAAAPGAIPRLEPRSSHGNPPYYDVNGRRYQVLASADGYTERGVASWYGPDSRIFRATIPRAASLTTCTP